MIRSAVFGVAYLASIPSFAMIYYFTPGALDAPNTLTNSLYFSTVTITTLGYGDILPKGTLGKLLAAGEAILGVTFIGLFLSSLSREWSEKSVEHEKELEAARYRKDQAARLFAHFNLTTQDLARYLYLSASVVTDPLERPHFGDAESIREVRLNAKLVDVKNCGTISLLKGHHLRTPVLKYYLEYESKLMERIEALALRVDLREFPEIETLTSQFLKDNLRIEMKAELENLLNFEGTSGKSARHLSRVIELIESKPDFEPHPSISNAMDPLHWLFHRGKVNVTLLFSLVNKIEAELLSTSEAGKIETRP